MLYFRFLISYLRERLGSCYRHLHSCFTRKDGKRLQRGMEQKGADPWVGVTANEGGEGGSCLLSAPVNIQPSMNKYLVRQSIPSSRHLVYQLVPAL